MIVESIGLLHVLPVVEPLSISHQRANISSSYTHTLVEEKHHIHIIVLSRPQLCIIIQLLTRSCFPHSVPHVLISSVSMTHPGLVAIEIENS